MGNNAEDVRRAVAYWDLWMQQQEYMEGEGTVSNFWGYGNRMRDFLLYGWRHIRLLSGRKT